MKVLYDPWINGWKVERILLPVKECMGFTKYVWGTFINRSLQRISKIAQIFLLQSFRFPGVLHNIFEARPGGLKKKWCQSILLASGLGQREYLGRDMGEKLVQPVPRCLWNVASKSRVEVFLIAFGTGKLGMFCYWENILLVHHSLATDFSQIYKH